jgi:NAD(P)-dependent dehydrogenase (short-subunit alcohol dehydrogenase family)
VSHWSLEDIPAQDGRTFVVTGGAAGLGLEISRALAAVGGHVILAVRTPGKGDAAAERIRRTGARGTVEVRRLDVSDLASVRGFAAELDGLDVLINNAGVMALPESRSTDGFELQLATNHLGHFALANLLLPKLGDRVVVVGSNSHKHGELDPDDLDLDRRGYRPYAAYAQSKLANLLFLGELQRRLTEAGSSLRATGGHPGYTATGIQGGTGSQAFTRLSDLGNALFGMRPWQGALPILMAATKDVPGDSYFGPSGPGELVGWPRHVGRSSAAKDADLARVLWARSASRTGVNFPL